MSSSERVSKRSRRTTTKFGIDDFTETKGKGKSKISDDSTSTRKLRNSNPSLERKIILRSKKCNEMIVNGLQSPNKSKRTLSKDNTWEIVTNCRNKLKATKVDQLNSDRTKVLRSKIVSKDQVLEDNNKNEKSSQSKADTKPTTTNSHSKNKSEDKTRVKKVEKVKLKKKSNGLKKRKNGPIKDLLGMALNRLSSNAIPDSLPCRESQFKDIFSFIESKLLEGSGGCMYISGVPGTGKTATVHEVRRKLEASEDYPNFTFIEVNGLKLSDPFQCYVHILKELTGENKSSYQAADILNERFSNCNPDNEFVILLVDELDLLRTRKQNILYHLFDWPNRFNSKLIVLTVANSMDLPEKLMINRVSSRLGVTRLQFLPYSYRELEAIITSRLDDLPEVFDCDALQLICRKVAAVSGDARRALDICRLSVEMAQMAQDETVSMESVDKALQEIFNSLKLVRIRRAPLQEKIFLQSIVQEFRLSGVEEANFIDIYKHHIEICRFEGHYTPSTVELEQIAYNLHACRLVIVERSTSHLHKLIRLNVSVDDINFAFKMDKF